MNTILITSTEEGIGKTAIALALSRQAQDRGLSVGYMKPKGTRLRSATGKTRDEDPMLARSLLDLDAAIHEMEPVVYSPTFVQEAIQGRQVPGELQDRIETQFEEIASDVDLVVVEGSGSQATGGTVNLTDVDIARTLDARILLVDSYHEVLDVDETLLAAEWVGERLTGVLFNGVRDVAMDELKQDIVPFFRGRDISVLGELPWDQALAGVSLADLASTLGAEILTSEDLQMDRYIERLTVGAMGGDTALEQFRRTRQAVLITGGDRSEIQTAALEASGIQGLVLTGGRRPSSAILGRAEEEGVPILLVQSDTRTTIDRVDDVLQSGQTRTESAVERVESLLTDHCDVEAILQE
jgi:BioD-like phosphotransacetylase family protein